MAMLVYRKVFVMFTFTWGVYNWVSLCFFRWLETTNQKGINLNSKHRQNPNIFFCIRVWSDCYFWISQNLGCHFSKKTLARNEPGFVSKVSIIQGLGREAPENLGGEISPID